jgi:hypothetical protein
MKASSISRFGNDITSEEKELWWRKYRSIHACMHA